MKRFALIKFPPGRGLTICIGLLLVIGGMLLGTGPELSWAAPGLHPDRQTVPPRPPPPPPPPDSGGGGGGGGGSGPPPPPPAPPNQPPLAVATPVPDEDANAGPAQPTPAAGQEDYGDLDGLLLEDPAEPEIGDDGSLTARQSADLSLTKIVDNPRPQVGDEVSFTITVFNSGPQNATNVAVSEPLAAGFSLESADPSQGLFSQAAGLWTISAISAGQSATLTLVIRIIESETITNTAQITGADQFDPDSEPGNNLEAEDDQDSVRIEVTTEIASAQVSDPGPAPQTERQESTGATTSPAPVTGSILDSLGALNWLYALIIGILVVIIGFILTNRSK